MALKVYQVDAFADRPFEGNPAAVVVTERPLSDALMQSIAMEMNLSETAFAVPLGNQPMDQVERWSLRWFTPACEVRLCGHATLATAHVLFNDLGVGVETIRFDTKSGELRVARDEDRLRMDFPRDEPEPLPAPAGLEGALGAKILEIHRGRTLHKLLVLLENEEAVRGVVPDFRALARLEKEGGWRGTIITAAGSGDVHFVSRFFAPLEGIDEDSVTGSAHTVLTPYWGRRLGLRRMHAFQASRRGGHLDVVLDDERVFLIGRAVEVMNGVLKVVAFP